MLIIDGTEYLTAREAAEHLGVSAATLRNQRSMGRSPMTYIVHLGRVLYPVEQVEAYAQKLGR
ncbi:helix-turn-helix domain-containing protein [Micromonospora sp. NPDC049891]|uniref:helix-turn-helix domain-containing protein n=1 Tax=Micromonospora sp. NPDC049891 TaxID=3155655 RepID=UPI00340A953B